MNYRKLRIAWSVSWGVLGVLLVMLWVRSYWVKQMIWLPPPVDGVFDLHHAQGRFCVQAPSVKQTPTGYYEPDLTSFGEGTLGFGAWFTYWETNISAPYWFAVLLSATFAALPWLPFKRFSLRTLLIAITLVAVGLGAVVWTIM